jgi:hypothetical protein
MSQGAFLTQNLSSLEFLEYSLIEDTIYVLEYDLLCQRL